MAYNGPGQPEPGAAQRTTYTLGDNISNIVVKSSGSSRDNVGSGRVVGFVIKLNNPIKGPGGYMYEIPDQKYVIFSSESIASSDLGKFSVTQMSGGNYKKSRKTRKNNSRRR
jgi:hypothetical protein